MVPPAKMTALASSSTEEKWTAGFNSADTLAWIEQEPLESNKQQAHYDTGIVETLNASIVVLELHVFVHVL